MVSPHHFIVKVHHIDDDGDIVSIFSVIAANKILAIQYVIQTLPIHAKETMNHLDIVEQFKDVMQITWHKIMIFLIGVRFITLGIDDRIIDTTRNYVIVASSRKMAEAKIDNLIQGYTLSDSYIIQVLNIKQVIMQDNIGEVLWYF